MKDGRAALRIAGAQPAGRRARPLHFRRSLFFSLFLGSLSLLFVFLVPLPSIVLLRWRDPQTTAFIEARRARLRAQGRSDSIDRRPVPLGQVAPALVQAVLAAEDARFFRHRGIDWEAVSSARDFNRAHEKDRRRRLRGASTITQQLAKNLWLTGQRTWARKAREAAIATLLDALVPKERILEIYLSAIEFGETTYGCEAASRALFGVGASRLSAAQSARLAALIPAPAWYLAHPAAWERRASVIEKRTETQPAPPGAAAPAR